MEDSVDGDGDAGSHLDNNTSIVNIPQPANINDADMQAMIWSDNPEKDYFKQLMEEEQMGRIFDGKSMDDSVIGNRSLASFLRDNNQPKNKNRYNSNDKDDDASSLPDNFGRTSTCSANNNSIDYYYDCEDISTIATPPRKNTLTGEGGCSPAEDIVAIVGMDDDLSTIANDTVTSNNNNHHKDKSNPRTRDFQEYESYHKKKNIKPRPETNIEDEVDDDDQFDDENINDNDKTPGISNKKKKSSSKTPKTPKTPPGLIRVPWSSSKKRNKKAGTPSTVDSTASPTDKSRSPTTVSTTHSPKKSSLGDDIDEEDERTKRKRMYFMAGTLGLILVVAIVALSMSLVRFRNEQERYNKQLEDLNNPFAEDETEEPTKDPSFVETTNPEPVTSQPTVSPTVSPTSEPTITKTLSPTKEGQFMFKVPDGVDPVFFEAAVEDLLERLVRNAAMTNNGDNKFITIDEILMDIQTKQYQAIQWLASDPSYFKYALFGDWKIIQRYVLAVFYFTFESDLPTPPTTGFDEFGNVITTTINEDSSILKTSNWLTYDLPECQWYSSRPTQACRADGTLRRLDIRDGNLDGTLPKELSLLSNSLEAIALPNNKIHGPIPTEFGRLTTLGRLQLTSNMVQGPIPTEIGEMTSLVFIGLGRNQITSTLPSELGLMTSLSTVGMEGNSFYGTLPKQIGKLSNLGFISLESNHLTGTIPTEIGELFQLGTFKLHGNYFTGRMPDEICNLEKKAELETLEANCYIECKCCSDCHGLDTYVPPPLLENTIGCIDTITTRRRCYEQFDSINLSFFNCEPQPDDWIGLYDSNANSTDLGEAMLWLWSCGTQDCNEAIQAGRVQLDSDSVSGEALNLRARNGFWPLPIGEYKVAIIRRNPGGPYSSYAETGMISIQDSC